VALGIVLLMLAWNGTLSPGVLLVPLHLFVQFIFVLGLAFILSALAVVILDVSYVLNLVLFLLMFLSPIGFRPDMVPDGFQWVLLLNPVYYMVEVYRGSMIDGLPDPTLWAVFVSLAVVAFAAGSVFFRAFRGILLDLE
jgi:ABC-type polysaccharide/polyol phosphate export permease